jgi:integrase
MSKLLLLLLAVHDTVHDLPMKTNYSEPKIFTGKADVSKWNKLSRQEQNEAISKDWYVYYSFRNPETGKLVRQTNIKYEANRYKTAKDRFEYLKNIQFKVSILLKKGYNPFLDNTELTNKYYGKVNPVDTTIEVITEKEIIPEQVSVVVKKELTIREAFEFGLKNKINVLGKASYSNYQGRIKRFLAWLDNNEITSSSGISTLNKKVLNEYLNFILETSRATNRNNTRADLSSLVQVLVDNELMSINFVKSISILKATPERNKTYSIKQESDILNYLKVNDPILLLYTQFIIYNLLRPIEVNRLKIDDLDLEGKKLFVKAKNKAVKVKIIPQKIIDLLPDFSQMNKNHYLFTPTKFGGEWEAEENNRRDYFSKKFKVVKDHFGLNDDYGLYSFRHTSITNLYKEFIKTLTPNETKSKLMEITGHQTMQALEKYLRDIDAALPEDYSHLL